MAINFPDSPIDGATHTASGVTWTYSAALSSWRTTSVGVPSVSPGGSNTHVLFNDSTAFGGNAGFTYNKSTNNVSIGNNLSVSNTLITQNIVTNGTVTANGATGTAGQLLTSGGSGTNVYWSTVTSGSPPGGSNTQIQFNNSGAFGGNANFTYDTSSNTLNIANNITFTGNATVYALHNFNQTVGSMTTNVIGSVGGVDIYGYNAGLNTRIQMRAGVLGTANLVYGVYAVDNSNSLSQWFSLAANGQFSIGSQSGSTSSTYSFGNTSATFNRPSTFNANVTLGTTTISANGGVGTAGQVLTSGASGNVYWSTVAGGGGSLPTTISLQNTTGTATASGANSVAVGAGANAVGTNTIAIGVNTVVAGNNNIAIGYNANTTSLTENSIAIGTQSNTQWSNGVAIGYNARSVGHYGIALGTNATAFFRGVVIGSDVTSTSSYQNTVVIGSGLTVGGIQTIVIGTSGVATGNNSIAIGRQPTATPNNSIAIGNQANVTSGDGGIAIGANARVLNTDSIVIGRNTQDGGGARVTIVGAGANSSAADCTLIGANVSVIGNYVVSVGSGSGSNTRSVSIGANTTVTGQNSAAIGYGANVTSNNSFAIGANNTVTADYGGAIGYNITNGTANTIIIGNNTQTVIVGALQANGTATVNGALVATTKSFDIKHPSDASKRLRYGSLEGPENGVYVRGRANTNTIDLPSYWKDLVHEDSITVNLTPIGKFQKLYVESANSTVVKITQDSLFTSNIDCYYAIWGERKDVDKLTVEY